MTGNPRCQRPGFLKEIPLQDVALPDFRCEEGMWNQDSHLSHRHDLSQLLLLYVLI